MSNGGPIRNGFEIHTRNLESADSLFSTGADAFHLDFERLNAKWLSYRHRFFGRHFRSVGRRFTRTLETAGAGTGPREYFTV